MMLKGNNKLDLCKDNALELPLFLGIEAFLLPILYLLVGQTL